MWFGQTRGNLVRFVVSSVVNSPKYIFILTICLRLISMVYVLCQISCYFRDAISSKVQVQVQEEQVQALPLNKTF